jgi:hypothetical protein
MIKKIVKKRIKVQKVILRCNRKIEELSKNN